MSKIQAELTAATGVAPAAGQSRQDFFLALLVGVNKLTDAQWAGLSVPAQDWFNDAADARAAKKQELPEMPDYVAEQPKPSSRRRAAEPEPAAATVARDPEVGDVVNATTKRGKKYPNAVVVELGSDFVAVQPEGTTEEADQIEIVSEGAKFEIVGGPAEGEPDEPDAAGPFEPAVGDIVTVTNKRGKATTGEIVEIDDKIVVVKDDATGEEVEFAQDRVASIVPVGGQEPEAEPEPEPEAAPAAAAGRRRSAEPEAEPAPAAAADAKPKRSSNPRGTSVGARIRELVAENVDVTEAEVGKVLKKEGLEFRDTTLNMIFKDCAQLVALLRAAKKIK